LLLELHTLIHTFLSFFHSSYFNLFSSTNEDERRVKKKFFKCQLFHFIQYDCGMLIIFFIYFKFEHCISSFPHRLNDKNTWWSLLFTKDNIYLHWQVYLASGHISVFYSYNTYFFSLCFVVYSIDQSGYMMNAFR
jgi:hypothetical protein